MGKIISHNGFVIGSIVRKKSGKPFKNGEYLQEIVSFTVNPHDPTRRIAAKFSDNSICNLAMLLIVNELI